jgi:hypothetical protein
MNYENEGSYVCFDLRSDKFELLSESETISFSAHFVCFEANGHYKESF